MFLGTHTPKLDDKGRLILPAKYRDELAEGLVITRFQERCLAIWPVATFAELVQGVRGASSSQQVRDNHPNHPTPPTHQTPHKQGRVTIPQHLRTYAGLERDCVVVGAINRVEVWDAAAWSAYEASKESAFADLDDEVFPGV